MKSMNNYLKFKITRGFLLLILISVFSLNSELFAQGFWQQLPIYGGGVSSIAINPSDQLYVASEITGVSKSYDNGDLWSQINQGLELRSVNLLASDRTGNVYASVRYLFNEEEEDTISIYFRSYAGGSWTKVYDCLPNEEVVAMTILEINANIFVAIYNDFTKK